jgi:hypothetical protein
MINGNITKIKNVWTSDKDVYATMSTARHIFMGEPLESLNPVKQGYLISLLRHHRKGSQVNPFYGLAEQWTALLRTDAFFKISSIDVQASLMKLGLLSYFDVNKYITMAFDTGSWKVLRQIMLYYGTSSLINREIKTNGYVPSDISDWLNKLRVRRVTSIPSYPLAY